MNLALRVSLRSLAAFSLLGLAACATNANHLTNHLALRYTVAKAGDGEANFIGPTNAAVDHLLHQMQVRADLSHPLLVATPQNVNSLTRSSPFGLALGELIQSRLSEHGYKVIEVKAQNHLRINSAGELLLSRDVQDVALAHRADTVIVGTWSEAGTTVYVTLKAIQAETGVIVASASFPLTHLSRIPER